MNGVEDVEALRKAAEIADDHDELRIRDWLTRFADRLGGPDPDKVLAEEMIAAEREYWGSVGVDRYRDGLDGLTGDNQRAVLASARAARAHIAAESGGVTEADARLLRNPESIRQIKRGLASTEGDVVIAAGGPMTTAATPAPASRAAESAGDSADATETRRSSDWVARPGHWAQIRPGARRGDVPRSVERVLVLSDTDFDGEAKVGWHGDAMPDGTTWDYLPSASLAPAPEGGAL